MASRLPGSICAFALASALLTGCAVPLPGIAAPPSPPATGIGRYLTVSGEPVDAAAFLADTRTATAAVRRYQLSISEGDGNERRSTSVWADRSRADRPRMRVHVSLADGTEPADSGFELVDGTVCLESHYSCTSTIPVSAAPAKVRQAVERMRSPEGVLAPLAPDGHELVYAGSHGDGADLRHQYTFRAVGGDAGPISGSGRWYQLEVDDRMRLRLLNIWQDGGVIGTVYIDTDIDAKLLPTARPSANSTR